MIYAALDQFRCLHISEKIGMTFALLESRGALLEASLYCYSLK